MDSWAAVLAAGSALGCAVLACGSPVAGVQPANVVEQQAALMGKAAKWKKLEGERLLREGPASPRRTGGQSPQPTILLIRHGETDGNSTGTIQVAETRLNAKGVEQARLLAARLAPYPLSRLLTSDLARALMTAEAIAEKATVELELEPELAERNFGDWRGVKYADLRLQGVSVMGADTAPPNGETWGVFHKRVEGVWGRMTTLAAKESLPVVLVCHGLTARSILSRQVECPEAKITGKGALSVGNTSLTVIVMGEDGVWRTALTNCTKHLEGEEAARELGAKAVVGI